MVINVDRSVPIAGNLSLIPVRIPPAMPPMNEPIAVPMVSRNAPPLSISSLSPGIFDNPPIAARTNDNSAITAPIPTTPSMAAGTRSATAARAIIKAESSPTPAMP